MRELIIQFVQCLNTHFGGKTVGAGGDFGGSLMNGPFTIETYFHQWEIIKNPSLHVQVIDEQNVQGNFECCGGVTQLNLNVRISVDQKGQGWSIAMAIYEELRSWLCDNNYKLSPTDSDYLVIVGQDIRARHIYEGDVFSLHCEVELTYLRRFE